MKTKNYFFLIIFLIGFGLSVQAKTVEQKDAERAAINLFYEKVNQYVEPINYEDIVIKNIFVKTQDGETMFYAFDFEGGGFAIIAAEDNMYPVIGYSYTGNFSINAKPESNYGSFIQSYVDDIAYIRINNLKADNYISSTWKHLLINDISQLQTEKSGRDVEPLLFNLWNQDDPYNLMCPLDDQGPGGRVYAGCVATAMSMIMHYWGYPEVGEGSHTYTPSGYPTQTANFGSTYYDWYGMQHEAENIFPWAIAELQWHCGVAVDMMYGWDGSGAFSSDVDNALHDYFRYNNAVYQEKTNNTVWMNMLHDQIDNGWPVYYSGVSQDNYGHAFVCDGYQDTDFHFNFGWSGQDNGYYSIYKLEYYRFQKCVKNFYPTDNDYPYYAEGNYEITTLAGSFTDGSGPIEDYLNNQSATWLINPQTEQDSVTDITLTFEKFDLEASDEIVVYDGSDDSAPVLATFTGANPPTTGQTIGSSGNQLCVTFETNGSGTAEGFLIEFKSSTPEFCSGMTNFTEPTATFSDGSGTFNYSNGTACMWKIEPAYVGNITLYFNALDTEEDIDVIKVYDGTSLIGTFSGDEIPDPVVASSGSMFITFNANAWINAPGFEAYYTIDNVSVKENGGFEVLSIYPNPTSDNIYVKFRSSDDKQYSLRLMSITGKLVYEQDYTEMNDWTNAVIDVSNLSDGIYMLNIQTDTKSVTRRIVVE